MDEDRHECQICGRQIKAKNGKIAHHGYQRPGWGYQTSSCAGARHVPYSKGHDALDQLDDNWQNECAGGIHFYITREEAEAHT